MDCHSTDATDYDIAGSTTALTALTALTDTRPPETRPADTNGSGGERAGRRAWAGVVLAAAGGIAVGAGGAEAGVMSASPFVGVTHFQFTQAADTPAAERFFARPNVVNVVDIDLSAAGLSFAVTPSNGASVPGDTVRETPRTFARNLGAQVAINGSFFDTSSPASRNNVLSLLVSAGDRINPWAVPGEFDTNQAAINLDANNVATILTPKALVNRPTGYESNPNRANVFNAIGGNKHLVTGGVNTANADGGLAPRTAVGVTSDQHLLLATVDGRQAGYSEGLSFIELADFLVDFGRLSGTGRQGANEAVNLDGGGSTSLAFDDSFDGVANPRVVNSPSDGSTPQSRGTERAAGSNLAVFARPNAGYTPLPTPPRPAAGAADPVLTGLTLLDTFDSGRGHFAQDPNTNASGSTNGVTTASTAAFTADEAQDGVGPGRGSEKLTLVRTSAETAQVRHLSGGGSPGNNLSDGRSLGTVGFVGFYLKTTAPGLRAAIGIDDGLRTSNGLERSPQLDVIADGEWHLYEFDLGEDAPWFNFAGGNGRIDGPNAYIDSVLLYADGRTAGQTFDVFLDTVAYNPSGPLAGLASVPEPAGAAGLLAGVGCLVRRRRRGVLRRGG